MQVRVVMVLAHRMRMGVDVLMPVMLPRRGHVELGPFGVMMEHARRVRVKVPVVVVPAVGMRMVMVVAVAVLDPAPVLAMPHKKWAPREGAQRKHR
jgi:hypothetical protein